MSEKVEGCGCYECTKNDVDQTGVPVLLQKMILCPLCGNRRCPKATYHGNDCTGSDDPHQEGSRYNWKVPEDLGKSDDPDYVQPKVRPLNEM
jgi:hypothetical protein